MSRCRMTKFARCFLPASVRMWNDLNNSVFDTGTLDGVKGPVNRWCFLELCFIQFSVAQWLVGLQNQFTNNFVFSTWAFFPDFNNNNNTVQTAFD